MAGNNRLNPPAGLFERIEQESCHGWMQRCFRLFDPDEPNGCATAIGVLEQGNQHSKGTEGTVRHAGRIETPRVAGSGMSLRSSMPQLLAGSVTRRTALGLTPVSCCVAPDGHWITTVAAVAAKCTPVCVDEE